MFQNLNYILTTDCNVIDTKNHTIYPIFRTGWTSLTSEAIKTYTNEEISVCKNINVLIRDPKDRFISGLNYYCQYKKLDLKETWTLVKNGKLIDRHFVPQFVWLMHLYKFYRGTITIKPFESIGDGQGNVGTYSVPVRKGSANQGVQSDDQKGQGTRVYGSDNPLREHPARTVRGCNSP